MSIGSSTQRRPSTSGSIQIEDGRQFLAGPGTRIWSPHKVIGCAETKPSYHARKLNVKLPTGRYRVIVDSAFNWNNGTYGVSVATWDAQPEVEMDHLFEPEKDEL